MITRLGPNYLWSRISPRFGSDLLIHFQKRFWNKVFDILKLIRKFKIYIWMTISGSKSVKKSQKMLKKATIWTYIWFFWNFFALANLKHINSYIMQKKYVMSLYKFRSYFFTLGDIKVSFSILLPRATQTFRKQKLHLFT